MAHLDRTRAEMLMARAGLDALILLSPESFTYATGAAPGVGTMWRQAGAVAVLVPADRGLDEMAVVSDLFADAFQKASHISDIRISPLWVETSAIGDATAPAPQAIADGWLAEGRLAGFQRPATFDAAVCWQHLADALTERGMASGRIGVEMSAISAADWPAFCAALGGVRLSDASEAVARLKMVKSSAEIGLLRQAVGLAEVGIGAVRDACKPGTSRNDLAAVWSTAIATHKGALPLSGAWEYISVGPDPWGGNAVAKAGDLIKVDVGCLMDGYTSDSARTFVLGTPSAFQARIHDALLAGFDAGSTLLGPGVLLRDVHRAAQQAIHAAGFPGYSRGHFGHGLGTGPGTEQWPFIAADSPIVAEPGMVLAFECPWYVTGLGGVIIENQFLITDRGAETMNRLPTGLGILEL